MTIQISHLETNHLANLLVEFASITAHLASIELADIAPSDLKGYWRERAHLADNMATITAEISDRLITVAR